MKAFNRVIGIVVPAMAFACLPTLAQSNDGPVMRTPPMSMEEREAIYNKEIQTRTLGVMKALALTDPAKSNLVYNIISDHYHALRARDEAINYELSDVPKGTDEWRKDRDAILLAEPFHQHFIAALSQQLTPAQLSTVKDKITYGKVQFTYNAYCSIIPNLTDEQKTNILNLLIQAREAAMDGGSAGEKSDIFQHYKDQINSNLLADGIDVAKLTQEWVTRQAALQKAAGQTNSAPAATIN